MFDHVEYEKCVCCGGTTSVPVTEIIQKRKHYIAGAGQMCERCFSEMYTTPKPRIVIDIEEVVM